VRDRSWTDAIKSIWSRTRAAFLLLTGDPLVLDRWLWLRRHLPRQPGRILDAGAGNGWFAINSAMRGHDVLGLGLEGADMRRAAIRATHLGVPAQFEVQDLRDLEYRGDLRDNFDCVVCTETIEHIIDDLRVVNALGGALHQDGILLVTVPNSQYRPMDRGDAGPWYPVEDGRHVRKGYTEDELISLLERSGLETVAVGYCSGWASQRCTWLLRRLTDRLGYRVAWLITLPLRVLPPVLDPMIGRISNYPSYSLCIQGRKVRRQPC